MGIFSFFSSKEKTSLEYEFWQWFKKHSSMIYNFEQDREKIFNKLSIALTKVNPDLTFEFSQVKDNGKREFVLSAGGIKGSFPSVELLYDSAPKLKQWEVVKFRQRRYPLNDITFGAITVKSDDVFYKAYKDKDKLGVILFFDDFSEKEQTTFGNIGYLFLDETLGEFDVETKLGFIEFHNKTSEHFDGARPLKELANHVDEYYSK